jgi:MoxR-like ATPase
MTDPAALYDEIQQEVGTVLIGNESVIRRLTISLLTRGHILLEGVPGVAKTTAANLFARATGLSYNRIQMTPDILPADITGTYIYREQTSEFELRKGPVFANLVVADEINRATPKTQSALLEAMQEAHVTVEGNTMAMPDPFMVIATQNPIEMEGTFELPEAQRDRFQLKLTVDVPDREEEAELLTRFDDDPELGPDLVEQVVDTDDLVTARETVSETYIDERVRDYILDIVAATRASPDLEYGASPRASLAFLNTTKARAAIQGREYVIPDDVKALAEPILVHRVLLSTDAELSGLSTQEAVESIVESVEPPGREVVEEGVQATAGDGGHPADSDATQ